MTNVGPIAKSTGDQQWHDQRADHQIRKMEKVDQANGVNKLAAIGTELFRMEEEEEESGHIHPTGKTFIEEKEEGVPRCSSEICPFLC